MPRAVVLALACLLAAGCASSTVRFVNATPMTPREVPARLYTPSGAGLFPAVVLLHGCQGVSASTRQWARWFRDRGYIALVVDSWKARGIREDCSPVSPEVPNTERFDDGVGALRFLQSRSDVDRDRVGIIGWSNGGVYSMALVNGPSRERARRRGVILPEPGYRAAVGVYPGGCHSLIDQLVERPLLVLIGDADDWTEPGPCVQMVEAMRRRGIGAALVNAARKAAHTRGARRLYALGRRGEDYLLRFGFERIAGTQLIDDLAGTFTADCLRAHPGELARMDPLRLDISRYGVIER